jgi:ATP-dependent DNA ligase
MYAGRAGTGMPVAELERVWQRLQPLAVDKMPLTVPPPRSRFGSLLVLSRVHWVRPEMVVEVSYVEWTPDGRLSGSARGQAGYRGAARPAELTISIMPPLPPTKPGSCTTGVI